MASKKPTKIIILFWPLHIGSKLKVFVASEVDYNTFSFVVLIYGPFRRIIVLLDEDNAEETDDTRYY